MGRKPFTWKDIEQDCQIETGCFTVGKALGARVVVPPELYRHHPYNAPVYSFLQLLRSTINELGIIHFPNLPFNKTNYTLAQGAPQQHRYSSNPYMTDWYQYPHQDTPPYPTAFGLDAQRRYFATWILSQQALIEFIETERQTGADLETLHHLLVARSLQNGQGILMNQQPGLLIIDNSPQQQLYHARTCNITAVEQCPDFQQDSLMYAFNEIGLLHYMDQLDSRRGNAWRDEQNRQEVAAFLQR